MSAPDIGETLDHKVGPLPMGVWLAAVAGGVGIAWWVRRNGNSSAATDTTVPDSTQYGTPNGVGQSDTGAGTGTVTGAPAPTTNEEWGQVAIRQMIARGYDPTMVDKAIRDYLAGNTLTTTERALIAETLVVVGPPPVPPPPEVPGGTTPPVTVPISTPPKTRPDPPTVIPPSRPKPTTPAKPAPAKTPAYRVITITPTARTLSAAVAAYNRRYHTTHTWQDVWTFNLRYRNASTVKTLKARGPNRVYLGSTFWVPK